MERLVLDTADPGYYLVRSTSTTVYVLDTTGPRYRMMRATVPGARTGRRWWDNRWAPLVSVESDVPGSRGIIVVGFRPRWVADPGGRTDRNEWWWVSREVTSIEKVSAEELNEFLAGRGSSAEETTDSAAETADSAADRADETDDVLQDPGAMEDVRQWLADLKAGGQTYSLEEVRAELAGRLAMADRRRRNQARRAQLLGEMTRKAVEDGLYDADAGDYTEALRSARGKDSAEASRREDSGLTERVDAAIEQSGQDEDDIAWATGMAHQLLDEFDDNWSAPARDQPAVQQVVAELNAQLGATLVAALSGSRNSKEPYHWEAGESQPDEAAERRLRVAHEMFHLVAGEESADVARVLFVGSNPVLNDDTIITALREDRIKEAYAAVRVFLTDGWVL